MKITAFEIEKTLKSINITLDAMAKALMQIAFCAETDKKQKDLANGAKLTQELINEKAAIQNLMKETKAT